MRRTMSLFALLLIAGACSEATGPDHGDPVRTAVATYEVGPDLTPVLEAGDPVTLAEELLKVLEYQGHLDLEAEARRVAEEIADDGPDMVWIVQNHAETDDGRSWYMAEGIGNIFAQMVQTELAKRFIRYDLGVPSITCDRTMEPVVIDGQTMAVRLFSCRQALGPPVIIEPYIP